MYDYHTNHVHVSERTSVLKINNNYCKEKLLLCLICYSLSFIIHEVFNDNSNNNFIKCISNLERIEIFGFANGEAPTMQLLQEKFLIRK